MCIYLNHFASQYHQLSRNKRILVLCIRRPYPFPCSNLPTGSVLLPNVGSGDKLYDPKHLESFGAEKGSETGPACICMPQAGRLGKVTFPRREAGCRRSSGLRRKPAGGGLESAPPPRPRPFSRLDAAPRSPSACQMHSRAVHKTHFSRQS